MSVHPNYRNTLKLMAKRGYQFGMHSICYRCDTEVTDGAVCQNCNRSDCIRKCVAELHCAGAEKAVRCAASPKWFRVIAVHSDGSEIETALIAAPNEEPNYKATDCERFGIWLGRIPQEVVIPERFRPRHWMGPDIGWEDVRSDSETSDESSIDITPDLVSRQFGYSPSIATSLIKTATEAGVIGFLRSPHGRWSHFEGWVHDGMPMQSVDWRINRFNRYERTSPPSRQTPVAVSQLAEPF